MNTQKKGKAHAALSAHEGWYTIEIHIKLLTFSSVNLLDDYLAPTDKTTYS